MKESVSVSDRVTEEKKNKKKVAKPFEWKITREDLKKLLHKFDDKQKLAA